MFRMLGIAVALIALHTAGLPKAQAGSQPIAGAPNTDSARLDEIRPRLRSASETILRSHEGLEYLIYISVPRGTPPASGYPVIYVLDGDAWFGPAVEIARIREWSRLPSAIVIGVGYPGGAFFNERRRTLDFTPSGPHVLGAKPEQIDGADRFLVFINQILEPRAQASYPIDPHRQILFGHSLGGLFALHALFTAPSSFRTYIAASPPLRLEKHIVLKDEAAFLANPLRAVPRLLVTTGQFEPRASPEQVADYRRFFTQHPDEIPGQTPDQAIADLFPPDDTYDKAGDLGALVSRLAAAGVSANFVEFAGDDHTPSGVSALNRGIGYALRPRD